MLDFSQGDGIKFITWLILMTWQIIQLLLPPTFTRLPFAAKPDLASVFERWLVNVKQDSHFVVTPLTTRTILLRVVPTSTVVAALRRISGYSQKHAT